MQGEGYEPNKLEKYADNVILAVRHQHTHIITAGYALHLFTTTLTRHIRILTLGGSFMQVRVVFSLALYTTPLYMVYFLLRYGESIFELNTVQEWKMRIV